MRVTREELLIFLASLKEERKTFRLSDTAVLSSLNRIIPAYANNRLVGICVYRKPRLMGLGKLLNLHMVSVCVHNRYQGRGIGTELVRTLVNLCRNKVLLVEIFEDNLISLKLFRRFNFRKLGKVDRVVVMVKMPKDDLTRIIYWPFLYLITLPYIKIKTFLER
jgi:ribosomal protein S18 acetylase RimI-like enzyme